MGPRGPSACTTFSLDRARGVERNAVVGLGEDIAEVVAPGEVCDCRPRSHGRARFREFPRRLRRVSWSRRDVPRPRYPRSLLTLMGLDRSGVPEHLRSSEPVVGAALGAQSSDSKLGPSPACIARMRRGRARIPAHAEPRGRQRQHRSPRCRRGVTQVIGNRGTQLLQPQV